LWVHWPGVLLDRHPWDNLRSDEPDVFTMSGTTAVPVLMRTTWVVSSVGNRTMNVMDMIQGEGDRHMMCVFARMLGGD